MRSKPVTERIRGELGELEQILARIQEGVHKLERTGDLLYLDSVALNLQGFYNGLENIFESIAQGIDQDLPWGEMWHRELLSQMTQELPGVRPAVISEQAAEALEGRLATHLMLPNLSAWLSHYSSRPTNHAPFLNMSRKLLRQRHVSSHAMDDVVS